MHDEVSIEKKLPNRVDGTLRKFALRVPECIYKCSGIIVFGKRIKSLVFSTDLSIIRNVNADAIMAVYPFTPQPVITQALLTAADIPVFSGVGGGLTQGQRAINLAMFAEMQGATGVVLNDPTSNEVLSLVRHTVDIPVVVTVARKETDFEARLKAGADIFNVSAAADTPDLVRRIKDAHPDVPVIATGGPTEESIMQTIAAGANAITWTPPSNGEVFRDIMAAYREGMKTIVLPKKNARDIEEIPESVREKLTFVPASHMDEVLKTALLPADRPAKQETEVPDEKAPAKKDETGANASSTESGQGGDNDA